MNASDLEKVLKRLIIEDTGSVPSSQQGKARRQWENVRNFRAGVIARYIVASSFKKDDLVSVLGLSQRLADEICRDYCTETGNGTWKRRKTTGNNSAKAQGVAFRRQLFETMELGEWYSLHELHDRMLAQGIGPKNFPMFNRHLEMLYTEYEGLVESRVLTGRSLRFNNTQIRRKL